jgi:ATP-dependent DNA helicase RecQ
VSPRKTGDDGETPRKTAKASKKTSKTAKSSKKTSSKAASTRTAKTVKSTKKKAGKAAARKTKGAAPAEDVQDVQGVQADEAVAKAPRRTKKAAPAVAPDEAAAPVAADERPAVVETPATDEAPPSTASAAKAARRKAPARSTGGTSSRRVGPPPGVAVPSFAPRAAEPGTLDDEDEPPALEPLERRPRQAAVELPPRPTGPAVPSFLDGRIARAARGVFGIERLRGEQARAIQAVLTGHDAIAVLPTGFGKSLIYQVPAVLLDRPVVCISPLIALMRDQEDKLRARGVPVVRLDSTLKAQERRDAIARVERGGSLVVLTTPETLQAKDARPALAAARPALLAVDEAHCISEWGHDFRPAYLQLAQTREALAIPRVLALTATATPHVREDVVTRLGLKDPVAVVAPPHRANLRFGVHVVSGPSVKLEVTGRLLQRLPRPGILYCSTTRAVDDLFAALSHTKIPCARYHGGMSDEERSTSQARFMQRDSKIVMIATSAFGMGIDKPDIRYIAHFQVPGSLEQYVQESGRAGRDGKSADCVLLFDKADLSIQEFLEAQGRPTGAQIKRVATALSAWSDDGGEGAGPNDLALSAGVPAGAARAVCAELSEAGLVTFDGRRRAVATVDAKTLKKSADELAIRFDILAMQDKKRLDAITGYAEADECRSVYIRRWFGEAHPPRCGRCDVCRIGARVRALEAAEARGEAPPPPEIVDPTAGALARPRRGRRGRRGPPVLGKGPGQRGGQRGGRSKRKKRKKAAR